jgi:hypothetical protein
MVKTGFRRRVQQESKTMFFAEYSAKIVLRIQ